MGKILKIVGGIVGVIVLFVVVMNVGMSAETKFKYDAQHRVEEQVGGDAHVEVDNVHKGTDGKFAACGRVTRKVDLMPGMSGPITSPFVVTENGMVMVGVGDLLGVVDRIISNNCEFPANPATAGGR